MPWENWNTALYIVIKLISTPTIILIDFVNRSNVSGYYMCHYFRCSSIGNRSTCNLLCNSPTPAWLIQILISLSFSSTTLLPRSCIYQLLNCSTSHLGRDGFWWTMSHWSDFFSRRYYSQYWWNLLLWRIECDYYQCSHSHWCWCHYYRSELITVFQRPTISQWINCSL